MYRTIGRLRSPRSRSTLLVLTLLLALTLLPALSLAGPPAAGTIQGDLGDAPDSTNHFGAVMTAYPWGVNAIYPTVYDPATGLPQGPLHRAPTALAWLGAGVTGENDADLLPDVDGVTNINPPANAPDKDLRDDGVMPVNPGPPPGIALPQCQVTNFKYIVTGSVAPPLPTVYANVWFDFNRDGDWADTFTCVTSTGGLLTVNEWAVRDQVVAPTPGAAIVVATPAFASFHTLPNREIWMRINIGELRATINPLTGLADGRGPGNGYRYGETEDYFLRFVSGVTYAP